MRYNKETFTGGNIIFNKSNLHNHHTISSSQKGQNGTEINLETKFQYQLKESRMRLDKFNEMAAGYGFKK